MITALILAYGLITGGLPEYFFYTILLGAALADSIIWATILYNIRDLWTK